MAELFCLEPVHTVWPLLEYNYGPGLEPQDADPGKLQPEL